MDRKQKHRRQEPVSTGGGRGIHSTVHGDFHRAAFGMKKQELQTFVLVEVETEQKEEKATSMR